VRLAQHFRTIFAAICSQPGMRAASIFLKPLWQNDKPSPLERLPKYGVVISASPKNPMIQFYQNHGLKAR